LSYAYWATGGRANPPEQARMVGDVQTIDIEGGLRDDATGDFATVGDTLIERGEGELIEAFRARARARAFGLGKSIVFGGLRSIPTDDGSSEVQTEQPKGV
jgi:hypothetical protein